MLPVDDTARGRGWHKFASSFNGKPKAPSGLGRRLSIPLADAFRLPLNEPLVTARGITPCRGHHEWQLEDLSGLEAAPVTTSTPPQPAVSGLPRCDQVQAQGAEGDPLPTGCGLLDADRPRADVDTNRPRTWSAARNGEGRKNSYYISRAAAWDANGGEVAAQCVTVLPTKSSDD